MKTSRIFIASSLLTVPLILALAWYVFPTPQPQSQEELATRPPPAAPAPAARPSPAPVADADSFALSKHVANGHPPRTGNAAAAQGAIPDSLPPEILDRSPVRVPLALLEPHPATVQSQLQLEMLNKLRTQFAEELGGPNADPESQAYRDRWIALRPKFDALYEQWFGSDALSEQQVVQMQDKQAADEAARHGR